MLVGRALWGQDQGPASYYTAGSWECRLMWNRSRRAAPGDESDDGYVVDGVNAAMVQAQWCKYVKTMFTIASYLFLPCRML